MPVKKTSKTAKAKPSKSGGGKSAPATAAKVKAAKTAASTAVGSAARTATKPPKPAMSVETFYVIIEPLAAHVHDVEPQKGAQSVGFSSFAEAKDRAIDQLISVIEEAEHQLHAIRRAATFDEYRKSQSG